MRETVPDPWFATQSLPAASMTYLGSAPTRTVRVTRPLAGVDPLDDAAIVEADPDAALARREDACGPAAELLRPGDRSRRRFDPGEQAVVVRRNPDRAVGDAEVVDVVSDGNRRAGLRVRRRVDGAHGPVLG